MNSLLLALVMSAATLAPMNQTPQLSVDPVVPQDSATITLPPMNQTLQLSVDSDSVVPEGSQCNSNQVYMAEYYYEYPGGPYCGLRYIYCDKPYYQEGCWTSTYNAYEYCWCP